MSYNQNTNNNPEYLTVQQLAGKVNVSDKFVRENIRRIPGAVKIGRIWRIRAADVEKRLRSGSLLLEKVA